VPPLDQPIQTPDVSGALGDQIAKDARVHDGVVDLVAVDVLDLREIHMRRPIQQHQHHGTAG
jgi:hypothetical protein